jgi:hypothetical protein
MIYAPTARCQRSESLVQSEEINISDVIAGDCHSPTPRDLRQGHKEATSGGECILVLAMSSMSAAKCLGIRSKSWNDQ